MTIPGPVVVEVVDSHGCGDDLVELACALLAQHRLAPLRTGSGVPRVQALQPGLATDHADHAPGRISVQWVTVFDVRYLSWLLS